MLGKRSDQKGLWEADRLYLDYVSARTPSTVCWPRCGASCSAMTISPRSTVRTMDGSVPPSLLATALLLQTYDKVSDAEAQGEG